MRDEDAMEIAAGLEQELMIAAIRLHPDGYGVAIRALLKEEAKRDYSIGAIYSALERLEAKGYLRSRQGEAEARRGGRRKLLFVVTGTGRVALQESLAPLDKLRNGAEVMGGVFA